MATAYDVLQRDTLLPSPCGCIYRSRSAQCTTFAFSNPQVPVYSVHDIARIGTSKARLNALIERGILAITDVPDDPTEAGLSDKQWDQVRATKSQRAIVDYVAIGELLSTYELPLSFFDYETYAAGVPRFSG